MGFRIPVKKTNAQVQSDGSIGSLQVGGVLVLPESIGIVDSANWSYWSDNVRESVIFGPRTAETSSETVTLVVDRAAFPSSVTVYGGGNRGRGQIYPDGRSSNITSMRQENGGILVLVS